MSHAAGLARQAFLRAPWGGAPARRKFNVVPAAPLASRWRLLRTPAQEGAVNMGVDVALMALAAESDSAILRVYTWAHPTLSLGRNQKALGWYDPRAIAEHGVAVVRRPTGGRAILHHREITYSVALPASSVRPREAYDRINALLVHALGKMGVSAQVAGANTPAGAPGLTPCFDVPSAGELTAGGRKLVGSAQWRESGAVLQHGSILVDDDQKRIPLLMTRPIPDTPPPATLHAILGRRPPFDEVARALGDAVRELEDPGATEMEPIDPVAIAGDHVARFRDPAWTWRR